MTNTTSELFSIKNLRIFDRPGVRNITPRTKGYNAGCHIKFKNGWTLSIQWGAGNYGDNHDAPIDRDRPVGDSALAEIAAWREDGDMVRWGADEWGETVQGYCSMGRVQHIIDLIAEDKLMQPYQPPIPEPEERAIDGWKDEG